MKDYYKILGINKNASQAEIRKSYRSLALKYHPDKNNSPDAARLFREINEAYEVLKDLEKKAAYDSINFSKEASSAQSNPFYEWETQGAEKAREYSAMNYSDFKRTVFNELTVIGKNSLSIGVILFIVFGLILNFGMLVTAPMAGVLLFIFWGVILARMIKVTKQNYINDKNKIKKN